MGQIKDYPRRLMNSMKYSMEFDKNFSKDTVDKRINEFNRIEASLDGILRQSDQFKGILEDVTHVAKGNQRYFDDLMRENGITREEVDLYLGEEINLPDNDLDDPVDDNHSPNDCDNSSFEMQKNNLTQFGQGYNEENDRDLESPL